MEIAFTVEFDQGARAFVASWDQPGWGGIFTQPSDPAELQRIVSEGWRFQNPSGCNF